MRLNYGAALVMSALAGVALAKLPAPTPEQEQAAATKKAAEQVQLEKARQELDRAQDRVADYYKRTKGGSGGSSVAPGKTEAKNMPKTTQELPGSAGPRGGKEQSAEAHSAPAK